MGNRFTVRVELYNATGNHYTILHTDMEKLGFLRTINVYGNVYHLPDGEYIGEVYLSPDQLSDKIKGIISQLGIEGCALMSSIGIVYPVNLRPVDN